MPIGKVARVFKRLKKEGTIKDYAIGGASAFLFYGEPTLTYDLDIFVEPLIETSRIAEILLVENRLRVLGYPSKGGYVMIDHIPVHITIPGSELTEAAIRAAIEIKVGRSSIRVFRLEYAVAILLETWRPKDRERLRVMLPSIRINKIRLQRILGQYQLLNRWQELTNLED